MSLLEDSSRPPSLPETVVLKLLERNLKELQFWRTRNWDALKYSVAGILGLASLSNGLEAVASVCYFAAPSSKTAVHPSILRENMSRLSVGLALLVLVLAVEPSAGQDRPLIMIDPGHGGEEAGVQAADLIEKDLVLRAAFVLAEELVARGYDVRLTRTGDYAVGIPERRQQAEAAEAALFISLHMNRDEEGQKHGIELYANLDDASAANAAEHVAAALRELDTPVLVEARPWQFLRSPTVPMLMIEAGFLTHPVERRLLVSSAYYRALAAKIADGAAAALAAGH